MKPDRTRGRGCAGATNVSAAESYARKRTNSAVFVGGPSGPMPFARIAAT
ncbi:DUF6053 domain-containing protein [Lysobacter enzymogenes]